MKTAVVILNWNGKGFLQKFLQTVVEYSSTTPDTKVIVADNASTDGSTQWIAESFPRVRVIQLDKNYGFTGGYNRALAQVEAEYYVLLNSDVEVTPNWLTPLVAFMDTNPNVAACMPKLRSYHLPEKFEYAGASGGYIDKYGYPFCRGRILDLLETDKGQYDEPREIFWASGAALFIRAQLYREAEGLDEHFFAHMEEIDLCWRLQRMGYKIMCLPQSVVYHVGGGALPVTSPRKLYLNYRNNLLMMYKNLPAKKFKRTLFMRMVLDGVSAILYLLQFKFRYFGAVMKAHFAFYGMIGSFRAKRKQWQTLEATTELTGVYRRSIVLRYFAARKKLHFSDLNF